MSRGLLRIFRLLWHLPKLKPGMAPKDSLSANGPKPSTSKPRSLKDFEDVPRQPLNGDKLATTANQPCKVEPLKIHVEDGPDGFVPGFLHLPSAFVKGTSSSRNQAAVILLSGAGGGVVGPSSMYLGIATKLASLQRGIPGLRLDYRYPARNSDCVRDVSAALDFLEDLYGIHRFVLVGWSFGGVPVFTVAAQDKRVIGCATVASQTTSTDGIRQLSPRPVLLLHGTGDRTLKYSCSERLFSMYGSRGDKKIELFEGDDHALTRNAEKAEEMLCEFIAKCAGVSVGEGERTDVLEKRVVEDRERIENMRKGGDLGGPERVA